MLGTVITWESGLVMHLRIALTGFVLAGCLFAVAEPSATPHAQVHQSLQPLIDAKQLAGVAVGLYHDGQSQVVGLGETRLGNGRPPSGDTLFETGSITKVFTGTLLALADQSGRLQESTPLRELLPAGITVPQLGEEPIRLKHLAAHTSGLPRIPDNMHPKDIADPYAGYDEAMLFAFLDTHTLRRTAGTEYEYSNLAAGLLGQLLARAWKTDYASLVQEQLFEPLHMKDTRVVLSPAQEARFATGYRAGGLFQQLKAHKPWDFAVLAGAGGVRSSVDDLLLWVRACLGEGPPAIVAAIAYAAQPRFDLPGGGAVGLGWHRMPLGEGLPTVIWHNGETGGYHAFLGFVPEWKAGIVVLGNSAFNFDGQALEILRALRPN